jgi:DNA-binding response OmpR family regulator
MHINTTPVVADDYAILSLIQPNLEARGYQVITAANEEEAVQMTEKEKPDLLILDIVMPGMDGFADCRKIKEASNAPLIMISAREGVND